jgi:hypothetical protein
MRAKRDPTSTLGAVVEGAFGERCFVPPTPYGTEETS